MLESELVPDAWSVRHLFPVRQAFRDDLSRLHGGLAQGRVLDDLTLHAGAFGGQHLTQRLQLADQLVDLLHRGAGHALQQRADITRDHLALALRLTPKGGNVAPHELADFPFHRRFHPRLVVGRLTCLDQGHVDYPRSARPSPGAALSTAFIAARECDDFAAAANLYNAFPR